MPSTNPIFDNEAVKVLTSEQAGQVIIVCEHASNFIPAEFDGLGLEQEDLNAHIAWDPGAQTVAESIAAGLNAVLVLGRASRLLFDCNRPPEAVSAIPTQSEIFDIPGNQALSDAQRDERVRRFHDPFRDAIAEVIKVYKPKVMITIHSFTPTYRGNARPVEIGILHDNDTRLANEMLRIADFHTDLKVQRNEPYGPQHGVTHTLTTHAQPGGMLNVMVEIRNDLLTDAESQRVMAEMMTVWIADAITAFDLTANESETPCQD